MAVHAQESDAKKTEASKPQPTDPVESKKGELNQAKPGGTEKLTDAEVAFIKEAGAGNAAEIKMAELALKNAESQDVKDFAQMMIKDHSQANDDLAVVARNHNIAFPPDAPEKEKALGKKMLDVKGAAFDKAYDRACRQGPHRGRGRIQKAGKEVKDEKLRRVLSARPRRSWSRADISRERQGAGGQDDEEKHEPRWSSRVWRAKRASVVCSAPLL